MGWFVSAEPAFRGMRKCILQELTIDSIKM